MIEIKLFLYRQNIEKKKMKNSIGVVFDQLEFVFFFSIFFFDNSIFMRFLVCGPQKIIGLFQILFFIS